MTEIYKHPEWRRLCDELVSALATGQLWTYDDIARHGCDPRTDRGRGQWKRFERWVLHNLSLHFENVKNIGYRVVEAREHPDCSLRQYRGGVRRMRKATEIVTNVRHEDLTPEENRKLIEMQARYGRLVLSVRGHGEALRQIAKAVQLSRLPSPLAKPEAER